MGVGGVERLGLERWEEIGSWFGMWVLYYGGYGVFGRSRLVEWIEA